MAEKQEAPDTEVGGGAEVYGIPFHFNVKQPNIKKCPEGYYWVSSHRKGGALTGYTVKGHCRKAGSIDKMQEMEYKQKLEFQKQKHDLEMQKKKMKLENKERKEHE